uniref:Uncharacterized protein n=1 Tax=Bionectria ochroleuca TaxID=29856 RepID=A0A0B7JIU5_BIOOC
MADPKSQSFNHPAAQAYPSPEPHPSAHIPTRLNRAVSTITNRSGPALFTYSRRQQPSITSCQSSV